MRGSAFITVLAVLALLAILMEIALQLIVSHVTESRRRGDAAYAGELARSGLEWARACIASGSGACDTRFEVRGGAVKIETRRDGELLVVTARGTVLRGQAEGPSRVATTRVRPPDPGSSAPAPPEQPQAGPEPENPPQPGMDQGSPPPQPAAHDPATSLDEVHVPGH